MSKWAFLAGFGLGMGWMYAALRQEVKAYEETYTKVSKIARDNFDVASDLARHVDKDVLLGVLDRKVLEDMERHWHG